jgi:hypothetical protein
MFGHFRPERANADVQMIDTSVVRVHQHGDCIAGNKEQQMGRSRGGLTSKIHAVVDKNGVPVQLGLTPGEAHDNRLCSELLAGLRPRTMLLADRDMTPNGSEISPASRARGRTSAEANWQGANLLQPISLPSAQSDRAILQQDQAMPAHRNPI